MSTNRDNPSGYPPIQLTVSANETDVFFRVSDQGGGIPQDRYPGLWSYQARAPTGDFRHFSQVHRMPTSIDERANQAADLGQAHLGMGLPMSRVYAEYWGGELQVMTLEGYGTDAYLRIPRLGTKAENLGFEEDPLSWSAIDGLSPMEKEHESQSKKAQTDGWSRSHMARS